MNAPDRLRKLLAEPGLIVMPAVWDGLTAKLSAAAGFKTAFLSGSCVAASQTPSSDNSRAGERSPVPPKKPARSSGMAKVHKTTNTPAYRVHCGCVPRISRPSWLTTRRSR